MKRSLRKGLSVVLALSMVVTGSVFGQPDSVRAAKKAKLATKKISIKVGQKKKIKIKKKNKKAVYRFKSSNKKVAKVTKKGVVTGKRKGTAKITVKEKLGKKTRTLGKVKVTVKKKGGGSANTNNGQTPSGSQAPAASVKPSGAPQTTNAPAPSAAVSSNAPAPSAAVSSGAPAPSAAVSSEAPAPSAAVSSEAPAPSAAVSSEAPEPSTTPDAKPVGPTAPPVFPSKEPLPPVEDLEWESIDLSTGTFGEVSNYMYDTNTGIFNAKDQDYFGFELSQDIAPGQFIYVRVKGTNNGPKGFRSWLVDANTTTCCNNEDLYFFSIDKVPEFNVGDFEIYYKLPANADCSYLFFKGISYGTNIEDLSISSIEVSYSDKVQIEPFAPTETESQEMVSKSLVSTGNNARIKAVIEKAKSGEDVTLAYIGGSVTEGSGAVPNSKCYAEYSCQQFADAYGTGENVHFVNAGMSGTPSSLGIVRYDKDVLGQAEAGKAPDILFVEFAVNDSGECTDGGAYEGLIRRALESGSAVVLIFSVFRDIWNMQDTYIPYGEHYDLPMVSMKDAVKECAETEVGFRKWYFADQYHPNNDGHKLMADCIMNLFETIDGEKADTDNVADVSAFPVYKSDAFTKTTMMGPDTVENLLGKDDSTLLEFNAGGFSANDSNTGKYLYNSQREKFEKNWMHTADSGKDALTAKVKCKNLLVVYKLSNSDKTGAAELYVDGKKAVDMNGFNRDGWNNATTVLAFNEEDAAEHTIEVKMAEGNEEKEFTLLALGYN